MYSLKWLTISYWGFLTILLIIAFSCRSMWWLNVDLFRLMSECGWLKRMEIWLVYISFCHLIPSEEGVVFLTLICFRFLTCTVSVMPTVKWCSLMLLVRKEFQVKDFLALSDCIIWLNNLFFHKPIISAWPLNSGGTSDWQWSCAQSPKHPSSLFHSSWNQYGGINRGKFSIFFTATCEIFAYDPEYKSSKN